MITPEIEQDGKLKGLMAAFIVMLCLALTLAITAAVYLGYLGYTQSKVNGLEISSIEKLNKRIIDCTTVKGDCYQNNRNQTDGAVETINQYAVYAAACADRPQQQSVTDIQECIIEQVDLAEKREQE